MTEFLDDNFLLRTPAARRLYADHAASQPILDYHCHLPPGEIAANRRFNNLTEIWLEGDHYKWRAMRANGVDERLCTGTADPYDKFLAWAATVPRCLRNPLYHWTHLELRRYFGITERLDPSTASRIWAQANEQLQSGALDAHGILAKFHVRALCTTDDPADDLSAHAAIRASALATRVYPAFRPDRALDVHLPDTFNPWVDRLAGTAGASIGAFDSFLAALRQRHQAFHDAGSRLSDHGLIQCPAADCTDEMASAIFSRARAGQAASGEEQWAFASYMMLFFGRLDAEKGWTKQLHLGARRNAHTRARHAVGTDSGYDSIGDWPQAEALGAYLDRLAQAGTLPQVIVYNVNPTDNYVFATMVGNFQEGRQPGKMQFGSGWWYLDQKDGMEWQIDALSNTGLLANFVGMTTDSRSFMSYPRHEYFRRVLCNLLGAEVDAGDLPDDDELLGGLVEDVCFRNARRYFGLDVPA